VVRKAKRKRQPLPDWYLDKPQLVVGEDFFLRAFWALATEKVMGSPIPHSKIVEYGERCGLDPAISEVLTIVIWKLDRTYSRYQESERKRKELIDKPSPAKRAK